jgi:hypothetical protein
MSLEALLMNPKKRKHKKNAKRRASAKQLAWRKKFAALAKAGQLKKHKANKKHKRNPVVTVANKKHRKHKRNALVALPNRKHPRRHKRNPLMSMVNRHRRSRRNPKLQTKALVEYALGGAIGLYVVPMALKYVKSGLALIPMVNKIDWNGRFQSIGLKGLVGVGAGWLVMNKTKYKKAGKAIMAGALANIVLKEFVPSVGNMIGLADISEMAELQGDYQMLGDYSTEGMSDVGEYTTEGMGEEEMNDAPELQGMDEIIPEGLSDFGSEDVVL